MKNRVLITSVLLLSVIGVNRVFAQKYENNRYGLTLEKKENGKILGPASLNKLRDEYRMRILLKGKDQALLNHYAWDVYQDHITKKARTRLDIDVSPVVLE